MIKLFLSFFYWPWLPTFIQHKIPLFSTDNYQRVIAESKQFTLATYSYVDYSKYDDSKALKPKQWRLMLSWHEKEMAYIIFLTATIKDTSCNNTKLLQYIFTVITKATTLSVATITTDNNAGDKCWDYKYEYFIIGDANIYQTME